MAGRYRASNTKCLVPGPPIRTRRADFPHRAPQSVSQLFFAAILLSCVDILLLPLCAENVSLLRCPPCPAASPCMRLSRTLSTTSGSDFHRGFRFPMDGPFSWRTPLSRRPRWISQVPWCFRFHRAVLLDPAEVSGPLALIGGLLLPSKFSTLSALGQFSRGSIASL